MKYLALFLGASLAACGSSGNTPDAGETPDAPPIDAPSPLVPDCTPTGGLDLAVEEVASGLADPLFVTTPLNDPRLFVVEQPGRILVIKDGEVLPTPFLDIREGVRSTGDEQGLLGLAFHPEYFRNGRFFINYTQEPNGTSVLAEYTVSDDPDVADAQERRLLEIPQFATNHNGGMIAFGPDGLLYVGMGDGGGSGDPRENGQDVTTLLGAMLRIDVDGAEPYAIPPTNPFADSPGGEEDPRPEIWAFGLRNPWRWSFDRETGDMYIGDVGQDAFEEIDFQPAASAGGENYGWDNMEGSECFEPEQGCDTAGITLPIIEYAHQGDCTSVTGGYVYRGTCLPDLQGHYIYADFCFDEIYRFNTANQDEVEFNTFGITQVTSFGEDATGELYIVSRTGSVFRLIAAP